MRAVEEREPLLLEPGSYHLTSPLVLNELNRLILASSSPQECLERGNIEIHGKWTLEDNSHGAACDKISLRFRAHERTDACMDIASGPWYFDNVTISCIDGTAIFCSAFAKLKSTCSVIGGESDEPGRRAYIAVEASDSTWAQFVSCSIGT